MSDLVCGKDNKIPTSEVIEAINDKAEDDDLQEHVSNKDNPHQVTLNQIGAAHEIHKHTESDITDLDKYTKQEVDDKIGETDTNLSQHIDDKNNPHETTPEKIGAAHEIHTHAESDIVDLDKYTKQEVDDKIGEADTNFNQHINDKNNPHETSYTEVGAAPLVHTHVVADTTGLQDELNGKYAKVAAPSTDNIVLFETGGLLKDSGKDLDNLVTQTSPVASAQLPTGITAQREDTPASGMIRYNSEKESFEGYGATAWGSIGGGATGGGSDDAFYENSQHVTQSYELTAGKNAMSAGPITIDDDVVVTIPDGAVWTIV